MYTIKKEYTTTEDECTKKIVELSPRKFEGIGPTTREGIPTVLRSVSYFLFKLIAIHSAVAVF